MLGAGEATPRRCRTPSVTLTGRGLAESVDSSGVFAPGALHPSLAAMVVAGPATILPGALTCFYSSASGTSTGLVSNGIVSLAGDARFDFQSPPAPGMTLTLVNASSISGKFAAYSSNVPDLEGSFDYQNSGVTFTVTRSDGIFRDGFEELSPDLCASAFAK